MSGNVFSGGTRPVFPAIDSDERAVLREAAIKLRDREARTVVARTALDRVAAELEQLAGESIG